MTTRTLELILTAKNNVGKALAPASKSLGKFNDSLGRDFKKLGKISAGLAAGLTAGAVAFSAKSVELANIQNAVEAQLTERLKGREETLGRSIDDIKAYASELQKTTTIGDESFLAIATQLSTFGDINGDTFDKAILVTADLATTLNNGVTPSMEQLSGQAIQVAKALNNPIEGFEKLSRVGVEFTDDQVDLATALQESGDLLGAQEVLLEGITEFYGGAAAAALDTFAGKQAALGNTFGDIQEKIGNFIQEASLPYLDSLREIASQVDQGFAEGGIAGGLAVIRTQINENLPLLGAFIDGVESLITFGAQAKAAIAGILPDFSSLNETNPLLLDFVKILSAVAVGAGLAAIASGALGTAFALLTSPITLIIAAVAAVIFAFQNWEAISEFVVELFDGIGEYITEKWDGITNYFSGVIDSIVSFFATKWQQLKDIVFGAVSGIGNFITEKFNAIVSFISGIGGDLVEAGVNAFGSLSDSVFGIFDDIGDYVQEKIDFVVGIIDGVKGKISAFGDSVGNAFDAASGFFGFNALGGIIQPGETSFVGEDGPELAVSGNKYSIVGANGPELLTAKSRTQIISNPETRGGNFKDFFGPLVGKGAGSEESVISNPFNFQELFGKKLSSAADTSALSELGGGTEKSFQEQFGKKLADAARGISAVPLEIKTQNKASYFTGDKRLTKEQFDELFKKKEPVEQLLKKGGEGTSFQDLFGGTLSKAAQLARPLRPVNQSSGQSFQDLLGESLTNSGQESAEENRAANVTINVNVDDQNLLERVADAVQQGISGNIQNRLLYRS